MYYTENTKANQNKVRISKGRYSTILRMKRGSVLYLWTYGPLLLSSTLYFLYIIFFVCSRVYHTLFHRFMESTLISISHIGYRESLRSTTRLLKYLYNNLLNSYFIYILVNICLFPESFYILSVKNLRANLLHDQWTNYILYRKTTMDFLTDW